MDWFSLPNKAFLTKPLNFVSLFYLFFNILIRVSLLWFLVGLRTTVIRIQNNKIASGVLILACQLYFTINKLS